MRHQLDGNGEKSLLGAGRRRIFKRYARNYDPWLGDVEIYFMDDRGKVHKLRDGNINLV